MRKKKKTILLCIGFFVLISLIVGAFLDFYPFLGDDIVVREVQFCTFLICMIIAVCTILIISEDK